MLRATNILLAIACCCLLKTARATPVNVPVAPCIGINCPAVQATNDTMSTTTFVPPTVPCAGDWCPTKPPSDIRRTVIFIYKPTSTGQDLFLRGGLSSDNFPECGASQDYTSPCAIPIEVSELGITSHYDAYNAYRVGDDMLDWGEFQPNQGTFNGKTAPGTAMVWTTTNATHPGFQKLNIWGDHAWMVEMQMDCAKTSDGWFELKSLIAGGNYIWEGNIEQQPCVGNGASTPPYNSKNHMARCGYINKFSFDNRECIILNFWD